jgi:hypothetical protein
MEPEGSLPCSQEPATCPYPEPNESNPHPQTLFHQEPFLMMSSHLRLGLWVYSPFRPRNQNVVCTPHLPHARHMPRL